MKSMKLALAAMLTLAMVCAVGCNKDKAYKKVTGTVTYEGQPLEGALVMFYAQSPECETGAGTTDANGVYTITCGRSTQGGTGLKPGEYKVTVAKYEVIEDPDQVAFDNGEIDYDELQRRKSVDGAYATTTAAKPLTPKKFISVTDTPFTATVTENVKSNVFDFNLDE
mgnify:CR=1 FL=1